MDIIEDGVDEDLFRFSTNSHTPISNIIISDKEIDEKEQIIILPISSTDTDMTANNDGTYTAAVEDQYIIQTIDTESLIRKFGKKSEVTSIILGALPAYKVDVSNNNLNTLISLEGDNNNITTDTTRILETYHDSEHYPEEMRILITKNVTNTTFKNLEGKKYGFKVGV